MYHRTFPLGLRWLQKQWSSWLGLKLCHAWQCPQHRTTLGHHDKKTTHHHITHTGDAEKNINQKRYDPQRNAPWGPDVDALYIPTFFVCLHILCFCTLGQLTVWIVICISVTMLPCYTRLQNELRWSQTRAASSLDESHVRLGGRFRGLGDGRNIYLCRRGQKKESERERQMAAEKSPIPRGRGRCIRFVLAAVLTLWGRPAVTFHDAFPRL